MATQQQVDFDEVVRRLGRYPISAFQFLHEGLDLTVRNIHGPLHSELTELANWMERGHVSPCRLRELESADELPDEMADHIEALGGIESAIDRMNRHVSGRDLCWGLRQLAHHRWGRMASAVLSHWGIRSTQDFGQMVFALVNNGLLQKQPHDNIEDFYEVYDFEAALERGYQICLDRESEPEPECPEECDS